MKLFPRISFQLSPNLFLPVRGTRTLFGRQKEAELLFYLQQQAHTLVWADMKFCSKIQITCNLLLQCYRQLWPLASILISIPKLFFSNKLTLKSKCLLQKGFFFSYKYLMFTMSWQSTLPHSYLGTQADSASSIFVIAHTKACILLDNHVSEVKRLENCLWHFLFPNPEMMHLISFF